MLRKIFFDSQPEPPCMWSCTFSHVCMSFLLVLPFSLTSQKYEHSSNWHVYIDPQIHWVSLTRCFFQITQKLHLLSYSENLAIQPSHMVTIGWRSLCWVIGSTDHCSPYHELLDYTGLTPNFVNVYIWQTCSTRTSWCFKHYGPCDLCCHYSTLHVEYKAVRHNM